MQLFELLTYPDPLVQRFAKRITPLPNGCWQWSSVRDDGYGTWTPVYGERCYVPQVWLYELLVGPIPPGNTLDHVCRNRGCVRVFDAEHIENVTHSTNIRRADNHMHKVNAAKTHCPAGHEYTPENTRIQVRKGTTMRSCKTCGRLRDAARRAK